jgi:hypothetical protein
LLGKRYGNRMDMINRMLIANLKNLNAKGAGYAERKSGTPFLGALRVSVLNHPVHPV